MKLSEISLDNSMDVVCDILDPIANISTDEEFVKALKDKVKLRADMTRNEMYALVLKYYSALIPILLKNHKDDLLMILARVNLTSVEEYRKKNLVEVIADIRETLADPVVQSLFTSAQTNGKDASFGTAQENISVNQ